MIRLALLLCCAISCAAPAIPVAASAASGGTAVATGGVVTLGVSEASLLLLPSLLASSAGVAYLKDASGHDVDVDLFEEIDVGSSCYPPFAACLNRWSGQSDGAIEARDLLCIGCYVECQERGAWPQTIHVPYFGSVFGETFPCI